MSGPQWIFAVLVAILTLGAFAECSGDAPFRRTPGRVALALVYPALLIALIVWWPLLWEIASAALPAPVPMWLFVAGAIVAIALAATLMTGVSPAALVFSVVIWVGCALSGELQSWIRARLLGSQPKE